jgi:two-component system sensor histidine kinase QseC
LIYRSVGVDTHPFVQQANFGWIKIHNQTYRSYSVWDNTNTIQVQIAQVWTIRQDIQRDMLLFLIVVSAFFPIIILVDFKNYTQSFVTVFNISQNLEKQSIEHLKPINPIVPKEIEPLVNSLNTLLTEIAESMQRENVLHQMQHMSYVHLWLQFVCMHKFC